MVRALSIVVPSACMTPAKTAEQLIWSLAWKSKQSRTVRQALKEVDQVVALHAVHGLTHACARGENEATGAAPIAAPS